jgi:hypothetical protein
MIIILLMEEVGKEDLNSLKLKGKDWRKKMDCLDLGATISHVR